MKAGDRVKLKDDIGTVVRVISSGFAEVKWDNGSVSVPIASHLTELSKALKYNHYFKDVRKLTHIDVYRVLDLYQVTDPCLQHAIKKLLVAGGRGAKSIDKDVQEAIDSLKRFQQMRSEEQ